MEKSGKTRKRKEKHESSTGEKAEGQLKWLSFFETDMNKFANLDQQN